MRSLTAGLASALALALAATACGGAGAYGAAGSPARACELRVRGAALASLHCVVAPNARAVAVRVDPSGDVVVAGRFSGLFTLQPSAPLSSKASASFLSRFSPALGPRFAIALDAPGTLRAVVPGPRGVSVLTSSPDAPEGPFLTRYDASGAATLRKDVGGGGLVTGAASDGRGAIVLRVQQDGLRFVVIGDEGNVLASRPIAPPWVHQFPASFTEDALVSELALAPDGVVTVHAHGTSEAAASSAVAMTKMSTGGAIQWSRTVALGRNVQIASIDGRGFVTLTPDAGALCPGPLGRTFAIASFDASGAPVYTRCLAGLAAGLHLMTDRAGRAVVTGQLGGQADLGAGPIDARALSSFVLFLDERGATRRVALIEGPDLVAVQAAAIGADGSVLVAGAAGSRKEQSHFFVASLRE